MIQHNDIAVIETSIRDGLQKQADRIVDEETEAAKARVAERMAVLKRGAAQGILTAMKLKRVDDPMRMRMELIFEV